MARTSAVAGRFLIFNNEQDIRLSTGGHINNYNFHIMKRFNNYFQNKKGYGLFFLRLIAGWRLIAGVWAFVLFVKPINEMSDFFSSLHLPAPLFFAYVSAYADFICGVLYILGLWIRPAAIVMIINFTVAIIAAHLHDSVIGAFSAWALLAMSLCILFEGAGKLALDKIITGSVGFR